MEKPHSKGHIFAAVLVYLSGWVILQCLQGMPDFNSATFQGHIEGIGEFAYHKLGFPEDFEEGKEQD